jgi:predicted DNA-binding transcriptional regulator YafY
MAFKDRPFFRRMLEFDDLMRRGKPVNASLLSKRWETSTKTAQRFVDQMRNEFDAPIEWNSTKGRYLYTDPNYHLPWLPVEGSDLFAIGVAMKVLQIYDGTPAAADMKVIFKRLSEFMPPEVRISPSSLVEKLYVPHQASRPVAAPVWDAVATALREKVALEMEYTKPKGEHRRREVLPYCLVLAGGDWFLLAHDPDESEIVVKVFYLTRISDPKVTTRRFVPPKDFKPEDHMGQSMGSYVGKKPFRFRVRVSAEIANWVEEVHWHEQQKIDKLKDGSIELELPAATLLEARRFILAMGKYALAISPEAVVADVRDHVTALAKAYG